MMRARGALHLCAMVNLPYIICSVLSFIPALVLHEVAHGYAAYKLGDPTAKRSGRLSLNPLKHIDPFGTVILPLLLMVMGWPVFGYAKPVPYNPAYFKDPRKGDLIVGLAGPAANLAAAWLCCRAEGGALFAGLNLALGCFNLLPVGRLDGGRALHCLLSMSIGPAAEEAEAVLDRVLIAFLLALGVLLIGWGGSFTLLLVALWLLAKEKEGKKGRNRSCQGLQKRVKWFLHSK